MGQRESELSYTSCDPYDCAVKLNYHDKIKFFIEHFHFTDYDFTKKIILVFETDNAKIYLGTFYNATDTYELDKLSLNVIINCDPDLGFNKNSEVWNKTNIAHFNFDKLLLPNKLLYVPIDFYQDETNNIIEIFKYIIPFIDKCVKCGTNIFIHSLYGRCKSICIILAFLIYRYLDKSCESLFNTLRSAMPYIDINRNYVEQLQRYHILCKLDNHVKHNKSFIMTFAIYNTVNKQN